MEGMILEVNKSMQQMIEFTDDEMIGYHLTDFLPEEDMDSNPLRIQELMQGKSLLYERRLKKKDGSFLDVEVNSKMASSHTLIGFIRDIAERKKIENKLIYQASLLEIVSDAVTSLDTDRCMVSWNNACTELYGYTAEEVIGKRIPELVTFEYPNTNNEEVFRQVFTEGKWKGEFNFIHPKTKEKINLLSNINLLKDNKGMVSGFIITSKNITDRIKAEEKITKSIERYELIAEATNDVIWDHDFINNITWGNKNLYQLYGMGAATKAITFEMFITQIHPDEREGIKTRFEEAVKNRQSLITEEFRFKNVEGEYRIFYDRAFIKYDDEGNPERILGAMLDITEREKAAELLQKSYKDIRQLASNLQSIREEERTSIAREIHDELGQQLTGLKMDIYWLSRKINTTDNEIAAKLKESIELINATVATVRKIATDLRPSILDDLGLIAALEWQGEEFEKRSGTRVEFNNMAGDVLLKPDAVTAIFRIYQELLTNVARHANASLVKVLLQKKDNSVFLSLTDNGTGFNTETISQKKTLGLLGIKERTLILGGTYEFKSRPGEGSETIISIPLIH